jgi:hypothetical protein
MTQEQFDTAHRAFCGRRPFRPFLIEFTSGNQLLITHPEAVRRRRNTQMYISRFTDGGYALFAAGSVSRLLDSPASANDVRLVKVR